MQLAFLSDSLAKATRPHLLPPSRILIAHKHRHEAVDDALLGGLRAAGLPLLPVLTDAGTRCKVWASDAARTALGLL